MTAIIENTPYRLRLRADNGRILTARRVYTNQGTSIRGKKWYKDMRWFAFEWTATGQRKLFAGIPSESLTKADLLSAVRHHPLFSQATKELS